MKLQQLSAEQTRALDEFEVVNGVVSPKRNTDIPGQTNYDDATRFVNSTLKQTGARTICVEFYCGATYTTAALHTFFSNRDSASNGCVANLYPEGNTAGTHSNVNVIGADLANLNSWNTFVLTVKANKEVETFLNGVSQGTNTATGSLVDVVDFVIGSYFPTSFTHAADVPMRNFEVYDSAASNPNAWTPGDINSLAGVALVMASPNGSGQDNQQGFTFTKIGSAEIIESQPGAPIAEFRPDDLAGFTTYLLDAGIASANHKHVSEILMDDAEALLLGTQSSIVLPSSKMGASPNFSFLLNETGYVDSSGNGVVITDIGTPGYANGKVTFNGSSSFYLQEQSYGMTQPFTIEATVSSPAWTTNVYIFNTQPDAGTGHIGLVVWVTPAGELRTYLSSTGTTWNIAANAFIESLLANTDYHIALTFDGTDIIIFVNDVERYRVAYASPLDFTRIQFGSTGTYGNLMPNGSTMWDVKIHDLVYPYGSLHSHDVTWELDAGEVVVTAVSTTDHTHASTLKAGGPPIVPVLNNFIAVTAPPAFDDIAAQGTAQGYTPGASLWRNTVSDEMFRFLGDANGWTSGPSFGLADLSAAVGTTQLEAGIVTSLGKADTALQPRTSFEDVSASATGAASSASDLFTITMSLAENYALTLEPVGNYQDAVRVARLGTGAGVLTITADGSETIIDARDNTEGSSITIETNGESVELTKLSGKWLVG